MLIVRWMVFLGLALGTCGVRADADLFSTGRRPDGKFYGATVMGHLALAGWSAQSEAKGRTDRLRAQLSEVWSQTLAPVQVISVFGRTAVPQREGVSVDIQPEMLAA